MTKLVIHGHRGSRGTHPENVIASFEESRDSGAEWIELDVHLSRDEELVVFHDFEIAGRLLRSQTLKELQSYDLGAKRNPKFPEQRAVPGARMPTLRETCDWKILKASGVSLNVEIKRDPRIAEEPAAERIAEKTVALLREKGLIASSLVQSFDHSVVRAARKLDSTLRLSCLFEKEAPYVQIAQACQAQVIALDHPLITPEVAEAAQRAGLELLPWTVNERADWDRLLALGVRSIITDFPRKLAEYRRYL